MWKYKVPTFHDLVYYWGWGWVLGTLLSLIWSHINVHTPKVTCQIIPNKNILFLKSGRNCANSHKYENPQPRSKHIFTQQLHEEAGLCFFLLGHTMWRSVSVAMLLGGGGQASGGAGGTCGAGDQPPVSCMQSLHTSPLSYLPAHLVFNKGEIFNTLSIP